MPEHIAFAIETPHATVFDGAVRALRVPTESGLVGIRPRGEPIVLAVEPGLVVIRVAGGVRFAATAGGILEADRRRCTIYTPLAASADDEDAMLVALERMRATPSEELLARKRLGELEQRVLGELGERARRAAPRRGRRGRA